jgi:uncharacterized protein (DUF1800 family)
MNTEARKIQHLYHRAGFGPEIARYAELKKPLAHHLDQLLANSRATPAALSVMSENDLKTAEVLKMAVLGNEEEKKEMVKDIVRRGRDLNLAWLDQMATTQDLLREKMTLFWHGHFACRVVNAFFVQNQNNTLRSLALGKFGDLLMAVSKDAAMLNFLNNKQNKKNSPNENFAREVMELFTLGRGHYTERDVKEAARAFTGWNFDQTGRFVFRRFQHDDGPKTFRGKTGNFTGEDIIRMVLDDRQTARFIVQKIYRYFVNDEVDPGLVAELAQGFYESEYDLGRLMARILAADWFYEPKNMGCKIKAPVELLTGLRRQFGATPADTEPLLFAQRLLGQVVFFPPNVAGWPGGKTWIDSSTIVVRTLLPAVMFREVDLPLDAKDDGDVNTEFLARRNFKLMKASANWAAFQAAFGGRPEAETVASVAYFLLQADLSDTNAKLVLQHVDRSSPEALVRSVAVQVATLPEYQLC